MVQVLGNLSFDLMIPLKVRESTKLSQFILYRIQQALQYFRLDQSGGLTDQHWHPGSHATSVLKKWPFKHTVAQPVYMHIDGGSVITECSHFSHTIEGGDKVNVFNDTCQKPSLTVPLSGHFKMFCAFGNNYLPVLQVAREPSFPLAFVYNPDSKKVGTE